MIIRRTQINPTDEFESSQNIDQQEAEKTVSPLTDEDLSSATEDTSPASEEIQLANEESTFEVAEQINETTPPSTHFIKDSKDEELMFRRPKIRPLSQLESKPQIRELPFLNVPNHKKRTFERLSNASLEELVEAAKEIHPLPREIQTKINKTHRNWFIAQLRKADTDEKLTDFAFSLDHQQLNLLFPILATVNKKSTSDKIRTIISLRLSRVLYAHGWITYQYIYPDNKFAKVITSICEELENTVFPFYDMDRSKSDKPLILNDKLDYPHFNWNRIHLISEVSTPDNRRFISTIVNYMLEQNIELETFFKDFGIYDDLSLGKAIKSAYDIEKIERHYSDFSGESRSWRDLFGLS